VLDLLGLVDPVISTLPGGYTRKTGPGYVQRVFDKMPRYFVFVGGPDTCDKLPFPAQEKLRKDRRFRGVYEVAGMVRHSKNGYWCIFERPDDASPAPAP
jgi:arabinofuranosyltransferase